MASNKRNKLAAESEESGVPLEFDVKGLRNSAEYLRSLVGEIEAVAAEMEQAKIERIEIKRGKQSYARAQAAISAWNNAAVRGLREQRRKRMGITIGEE